MDCRPVASDEALLSKIAKHDQTALSELYNRYAKIIYSVAFNGLKSVEESEEVVLDVFSQVWRIAERYDATKGRVDTWLFMLVRSRILDKLRKQVRIQLSSPAVTKLSEIQTSSISIDPTDDVIINERRARVLAALQLLPPEQRQVIELAYYHGLSHSQISVQTSISLGTVKTRIRLGLNKLKSALE
ncbi:RNA polymerase, sigma-24 subunit, ECF subfamily protein [Calothrix sp. NIES-4071]|nr:RNA polymerase, sigma-24 subunit, ECF subfamily protein [Calothrix sp. NIES-4071]BAZ61946.1 RNA polymerase, sigma-24 subunit, ECF subfamily protein [Calothrix sp. NIES-4105]